MTGSKKSGRIGYVDVARGIAMICIILGHFGEPEINRFVYTFHVPIFLVISGRFLDTRSDLKQFVRKKARTLLIPYAVTCLLVIVSGVLHEAVFSRYHEEKRVAAGWLYAGLYGSGNTYDQPFYIQKIGAAWFLLAMFFGLVTLRLILMLGEKWQAPAVALLFLAGWYSSRFLWLPLSIQSGLCSVLYLYIGYIFKENRETLSGVSKTAKVGFALLSFAVWISFVRNFTSFWIVGCDFGRGASDIVASLFSCCFVLILSWLIEKNFKILPRFLSFLGRYSIFILCIHTVELDTFQWYRVIDFLSELGITERWQYISVIIFIRLALCICAALLCSKIEPMKRLFGISAEKNEKKALLSRSKKNN